MVRLAYCILILLISTMGLMGQGRAFAATNGMSASLVPAQTGSVISDTDTDLIPAMPLLSDAGSCCVCGPSAHCLTGAPKVTFARLTRAMERASFAGLETQPPRDPPRI